MSLELEGLKEHQNQGSEYTFTRPVTRLLLLCHCYGLDCPIEFIKEKLSYG